MSYQLTPDDLQLNAFVIIEDRAVKAYVPIFEDYAGELDGLDIELKEDEICISFDRHNYNDEYNELSVEVLDVLERVHELTS